MCRLRSSGRGGAGVDLAVGVLDVLQRSTRPERLGGVGVPEAVGVTPAGRPVVWQGRAICSWAVL